MYRPRGVTCCIIDFHAGAGSAALAAARSKLPYIGFAKNLEHVNLIKSMLCLQIICELVDGVNDGFLIRRFLSRQRSVEGGHTPIANIAPAPVPPARALDADAAPAHVASSSSSSSDDDDS